MIDPDALNVWNNQRLVGHLWRNTQGQIGFSYSEEWIAQNGFTVSHTLPLVKTSFSPEDGIAHRFFANLLPEGNVREQIVRDLKIANTDFDLLRAIGGECAGALSLLQVEQEPATEYSYHPLQDNDLARLVTRKGHVHNWAANKRPRLSLAGAQHKCPVFHDGASYWLPEAEAPSTHILKFELSDYRHLPAYETFTTRLAAAVGLPVVSCQLNAVEKTYFALIERYDRVHTDNDGICRLHQEDFCQALGYGHERKYQQDGGPSFAECYNLVREVSSNPAIDLQNLLNWQIFNVLAGNSDGHAKNLSLLYTSSGEIRLAPFYDLVCTRAIARIDEHLAFSVGQERHPGKVTSEHWKALANDCDVRAQFLIKQVKNMANKLLANWEPVRETIEADAGDYGALQRIESVVVKQCKKVLG